jgi:hypothetical protein
MPMPLDYQRAVLVPSLLYFLSVLNLFHASRNSCCHLDSGPASSKNIHPQKTGGATLRRTPIRKHLQTNPAVFTGQKGCDVS